MTIVNCKTDDDWLSITRESLRDVGYMVIEGVLNSSFIHATRTAMYQVQEKIIQVIGKQRLHKAGELGVLRIMMKYDSHFLEFLEIPELLAIVDKTVSSTAILHLQNGFILPSFPVEKIQKSFKINTIKISDEY